MCAFACKQVLAAAIGQNIALYIMIKCYEDIIMLALSELLQKVLDLKSATCQALFKDDTLLLAQMD